MMSMRLRGGTVLDRDGPVSRDIAIDAGRVVDPRTLTRSRTVDVTGLLVSPGFVELQTNGGHGIDLTIEPDRVWELGQHLPEQGVTAFLPTVVSAPSARLDAALAAVSAGPPDGYHGAAVLGLHAEGPMLAPSECGAHPVEHLLAPRDAPVSRWSRSDGLRMVTIAPELPGALEAITVLSRAGVVVSLGHSAATAARTRDGARSGATAATHLFNGMPPIAARAPGIAAAVLADVGIVAGLIADGVHVEDEMLRLAWIAKGADGIALVTDAIAAAGSGDRTVQLGEATVHVADGRATLADGTLAGSVATLDGCVRHLTAVTGAPADRTLRTVTRTPARLLGEAQRGTLDVGARGDVTLLDDELHVVATLVAGQVVHDPDGRL